MTEMLLGNDNTIEFQRSYGMMKRVGYYTSIIGKDNDLLKENGASYTARPEMNFEQFKEYIKNTILSYLPAEFADASVKVERFNKLGQSSYFLSFCNCSRKYFLVIKIINNIVI